MSDEFNIVEPSGASEFNIVEPAKAPAKATPDEFNIIEAAPATPAALPTSVQDAPYGLRTDPKVSPENQTSLLDTMKSLYHHVPGVYDKPSDVPEYLKSPLGLGYTAVGKALNAAQEYIGRPLSNALEQADLSKAQPSMFGLQGQAHDISQIPQAQRVQQPERLTSAPSYFSDPRPTKQEPADFHELLTRQLLSTLAGNDITLNEDEAYKAIKDAPGSDLNKAAKMFVADQVGGLPLLFVNPGAKVVAGERALLKEAVQAGKYEPVVAEQIASKLARKEGAITGASIGAAQDSKEGNAPGVNTVFGAVLGHLASGAHSEFGGAKSEVLAMRNSGMGGVIAPVKSWEAFVQEAESLKNAPSVSEELQTKLRNNETQNKIKEQGLEPYVSARGYDWAQKQLSVQKPRTAFDNKQTPTYKTVELDQDGKLWDVGYKVRASTQRVEQVSQSPITQTNIQAWRDNKRMPAYIEPFGTDKAAYAKLSDLIFGQHEDVETISANMERAAKERFLNTPKDELGGDPTVAKPLPKDVVPASQDKVLINKNDGVVAVPIAAELDRTAPSKPKVGDAVKMPDGRTVFVQVIEPHGKMSVEDLSTKQKFKVGRNEVVPAHEAEIGPEATSKPSTRKQFTNTAGEGSLLKQKRLTIQRVMKAVDGTSPTEAAGILHDMEKAGQVLHDGTGNYFVRESYKPKPVDRNNQIGMAVFFGKPQEGYASQGILRGPDPKKPGNWLIEVGTSNIGPRTQEQSTTASNLNLQPQDVFASTKTISVDPQTMKSVRPQLYDTGQLAQLPQQLGITRPMPPQVVTVQAHVQRDIQALAKMAQVVEKGWNLTKELKDKAAAVFYNDIYKIPTDIQPTARAIHTGPKQVEAQANVGTEFLGRILNGIKSPEDTSLVAVMKENASRGQKPSQRDIELAKWSAKNPQLSAEVHNTVKTALDELKFDQEWLAKNNVKVGKLEALRAQGLEEEYLTQPYIRNMMRRQDYAKFLRTQTPEVWDAAVQHLMERNPQGNYQDSIAELTEILQLDMQKAQKAEPGSNVAKKLIARKEIDPVIAKLLGKTESAAIQLAQSKAVARGLRNKIENWNLIQNSPYWSPGPREDLGATGGLVVPNSPVFGKAAGGRIHESLAPLLDHKAIDASSQGLLRSIGAYWKFNVVPAGGLAPWVNNVMRNWKGMVLSGGLDEVGDFNTFFTAAKQMLDYKSNPILYGPNKEFIEAMNSGSVSTGFANNEIYKEKHANAVLRKIMEQQGKSPDVFALLHDIKDSVKGKAQDIGAAYDTIDRLFKFTAYLNIKRKLLNEGLPYKEAVGVATLRINDSFPNYETVAPIIEKWRNGTFGSFAPFLSAKAEDMRINMSLPQRLIKEPDLKGRVLKASAVMAGMYFYMKEIRRANGITDEMAAKGLDEPTLKLQQMQPMSFVGPTLDEKGNMWRFDVTTWEDAFMQARIHPLDPVVTSVLRNNMVDVYGQDSAIGAMMDEALSKTIDLHPLMNNRQMPSFRPGEATPVQLLSWLASQGAVPQFPSRLMSAFQKGQPNSNPLRDITQEQWTPNEVLAKQLGMPFAGNIGPKTSTARALEMSKSINDVKNQMQGAVMQNVGNPQEQKRLLDAKTGAIEQTAQEYQNRGK